MKKRFKEMSLRSIIMILCSSFVSLIIVTSATFYITGISHINNLVKQNAANLTIQAAENMDKRFRKVKDSFFSSIMESYYFLKMGQNIMENRQPISALCGAGKKNPGLCKSEQAGCQRCYSYALQ